MISKFKIKSLMVNVAPEELSMCRATTVHATNCGSPAASCNIGPPPPSPTHCVKNVTCLPSDLPPRTQCDRPTCKGVNDEAGEARGLDEPARSSLALLQQELRKAISLER